MTRTLAALALVCAIGCSETGPPGDPVGPCSAVIQHHPDQGGGHVAEGTRVLYSSNPPSSGMHYAIWAQWATIYELPVPRPYYVHNLEHGGIVLLYHCPEGCEGGLARSLAELAVATPDPLCTPGRWLVTPDNMLDPGVTVAAATWTWTYTASCLDEDTLVPFLAEHLGHGTEEHCENGINLFP